MRKGKALFAIALTGTLLWASDARAGFGIAGSIGSGFFVKDGNTTRLGTNFEVLPHYKIAMIYADLGIVGTFERDTSVSFRPGVRLDLSLLYARLAVPLRMPSTSEVDYGLLIGVGKIFQAGPIGVFVEVDVAWSDKLGWGYLPVEFRGGVQFGF
jgi:hypothetical protein